MNLFTMSKFAISIVAFTFSVVCRADDNADLAALEAMAASHATTLASMQSQLTTLHGSLQSAKLTLPAGVAANDANQVRINALDPRVKATTEKTKFFFVKDKSLMVVGANLHLRHGNTADAANNGLGNLILGYNAGAGMARTGSLNLVIGPQHSYTGRMNVIAGWGHAVQGNRSFLASGYQAKVWSGNDIVMLTGTSNSAWKNYGILLTGFNCGLNSLYGIVAAGMFNSVANHDSTVLTGSYNSANGVESLISTGKSLTLYGTNSSVGTGSSRSLNKDDRWVNKL